MNSIDPKGKNVLHGIAAAPGLNIATAFLYNKEIESVSDEAIVDIEESKELLLSALQKSKKELNKIFGLAVDKLGEKRAAIFEAQLMILEDTILIDNLLSRIEKEKRSPEYIVFDEISKYQNLMNESSEYYLKERAHDIDDIKNRIIRNIKNKKWRSKIKSDVIVIAELITPADTVLFTRVNVKGYITNFGGLTSHAAIVARSLNLPAVLGVHDATAQIKDGDKLIIDGFHGDIIINPSKEQEELYRKRIERINEFDKDLLKLKEQPGLTKDGRRINMMANLDVNEEIEFVMQNGAEGIGLIRTEQLFGVLENFPEEENQFNYYSVLAEKLYPHSITIRAFDIGGDKVLPFNVKEPNPMLGWRGIRFLLDHDELFTTQIRAVLRASVHNNVKFMIPMVSSIREIRKTREIIERCKEDLKKEGKEYGTEMEVGIMLEVPSASLLIKEFAECADFFSIGTNDLIQYLLAVDRGNDIINDSYQEFHPAVIRALDYMVKSTREVNTTISICGEMAADLYAIPLLVGLGIESFSVNAFSIPHIKKIIRNLSYSETKELAEECLKFSTEREIKSKIKKFYDDRFTEEIEEIFH